MEEVDSCVESTKRAEKFEIPSVTSSTLQGSRGHKLWVSIIDIGGGIENHLDDEERLELLDLLVTFRENKFTSSDLNKTKYKNHRKKLNNSAIEVLAEHQPPETM